MGAEGGSMDAFLENISRLEALYGNNIQIRILFRSLIKEALPAYGTVIIYLFSFVFLSGFMMSSTRETNVTNELETLSLSFASFFAYKSNKAHLIKRKMRHLAL